MLCARSAWAADADLILVFIDARQDAYVVFQGVSQGTPAIARREMEGYATLDRVSLVAWDNFRENVETFVAAGIQKNEYPGRRTPLGILALLKAYPGRPFAVTWNGGIASSFFDFQHAVEVLEEYREDAEAYELRRSLDANEDPLSPDLQLKTMLDG